MATILLSAAGAAVGAGFGGTVLGLSGAVIGRAVGATIGRSIDQRVIAGGSEPVEVGRVERFRLTGASEGSAIPRHWGRMRVGGQVIWSTQFNEIATTNGGGKGAPAPKSTSFAYTVSLAVALCEGAATAINARSPRTAGDSPMMLAIPLVTDAPDPPSPETASSGARHPRRCVSREA